MIDHDESLKTAIDLERLERWGAISKEVQDAATHWHSLKSLQATRISVYEHGNPSRDSAINLGMVERDRNGRPILNAAYEKDGMGKNGGPLPTHSPSENPREPAAGTASTLPDTVR